MAAKNPGRKRQQEFARASASKAKAATGGGGTGRSNYDTRDARDDAEIIAQLKTANVSLRDIMRKATTGVPSPTQRGPEGQTLSSTAASMKSTAQAAAALFGGGVGGLPRGGLLSRIGGMFKQLWADQAGLINFGQIGAGLRGGAIGLARGTARIASRAASGAAGLARGTAEFTSGMASGAMREVRETLPIRGISQKVGMVLGGGLVLGAALSKAAGTVTDFVERLRRANASLAEFSPAMAAVQAQAQFRTILREREIGERAAGAAGGLESQVQNLLDETKDFRAGVMNFGNNVGAALVDAVRGSYEIGKLTYEGLKVYFPAFAAIARDVEALAKSGQIQPGETMQEWMEKAFEADLARRTGPIVGPLLPIFPPRLPDYGLLRPPGPRGGKGERRSRTVSGSFSWFTSSRAVWTWRRAEGGPSKR